VFFLPSLSTDEVSKEVGEFNMGAKLFLRSNGVKGSVFFGGCRVKD
jgi:hypothetical protein